MAYGRRAPPANGAPAGEIQLTKAAPVMCERTSELAERREGVLEVL